MTLAALQAKRASERYAVDQMMPGVNDAADRAYREMLDCALSLREAVDAMNAALADPFARAEAASGLLEMREEHIMALISEAGFEYVEMLLDRIDASTARIRERLEK